MNRHHPYFGGGGSGGGGGGGYDGPRRGGHGGPDRHARFPHERGRGRGRGRGGYNNHSYGPGPGYDDGPSSYGQWNDAPPPDPYYGQNADYGDPYAAYDNSPPMYDEKDYGSHEGALS